MPPIRTPLGRIDPNRVRGKELSPYDRGKIVGMHAAGMSQRQIEDTMKRGRKAVKGALALDILNTNGASMPRPGGPRVYNERDRRTMLRNLRCKPKLTFQQRRDDTGLEMSNTYIKNLARANGLKHWRAKKRPELTKDVAAQRLLWCKCRAHWKVERWRKYIWSDECSAERGKGKKQVWVFGHPIDKWKPEMVETYKKGKDLRIMVWACFWGNGERSPLFVLERDFESKKHRYSANSYIAVLEEHLVDASEGGLIFMQDNAPIHTAKKVKEWFEANGVDTSDWPPYSPDLNPIEHAWKALKELVMQMFPDVWNGFGKGEVEIQAIEEALKVAWDALPDSLFESLVESMPARIQACIDADGWHTKY